MFFCSKFSRVYQVKISNTKLSVKWGLYHSVDRPQNTCNRNRQITQQSCLPVRAWPVTRSVREAYNEYSPVTL